ncbi:Transposase, Mutator family [Planctomycetes bacterium Pan216]|uniref:Mutator family transposase n=1 Tax=Kolteria novifilia TaxID=2527975 RepID=A0A518B6T4_9BACT|nr:Transposase, Mutator family [Planctomycetes bacterium Pan216]
MSKSTCEELGNPAESRESEALSLPAAGETKSPLDQIVREGAQRMLRAAIGDGALGFWAALRKVYGETREQRCWLHKTANVLNKMPKSVQPKAKADLHEIWMAATREEARKAFDHFVEKYGAKYPGASQCLEKDRDVLLTFYDFPAEHWKHLRTTNPIESTFATIRLRQRKTKGCGSRRASLTMMFKLAHAAQKGWRRLNGYEKIIPLLEGKTFVDGDLQDAA